MTSCVCWNSIRRNPRWHGGYGRFWCADSDQIFIWIKLKSFPTFFHWKVQQIQITSPGQRPGLHISNTTTVASKMQIVCSVQKCKWPDIWSRAKDLLLLNGEIQCKWQWLYSLTTRNKLIASSTIFGFKTLADFEEIE